MTDKWKLDPGGFLPFLNLLRDNSNPNKAREGGFLDIIEDVIIRRHHIFSDMRIANAV